MRSRRLALLTALPALLGAGLPAPPSSAAETRSTYVVLLHAATPDAGVARAEALGADVLRVYRYAVRGYAATLTPDVLAALRADPAVASITPNATGQFFDTQANPPWGLDRIDQRALPLDSGFTYGATGAGVTAYVIDSGIRTSHAEFGGRAVSGFSAVDGVASDDCKSHGTHVAGTIGGETYGVAKDVRLVDVRVATCLGLVDLAVDAVTAIAGIDWVTLDHLLHLDVPAVANMSFGFLAPHVAVDAAVSGSIATGISYAVAAGNGIVVTGNPVGVSVHNAAACLTSPARVPLAMTTGATSIDDRTWSGSNYGPCIDWYAPGDGVLSASWTSDTASRLASGTSMASPHTAGVAALYLQLNPTALPLQVHQALGAKVTPNVVMTPGESSSLRAPVGPDLETQNDDLLYTDF